jgi:hypothetical protein
MHIASNGSEVNILDLDEASEAASMAAAKPKSWRDVLPIHPAAELLPRPSQDELVALGEDIKANGLHIQIAIFNATAEAEGQGRERSKNGDQFSLLDGISRLDAMEAVGLGFDLTLIAGDLRRCPNWLLTTDDDFLPDGYLPAKIVYSDPYGFVLSANLHRRHLTAEEKRELVAKLIKATPEKSDRQIAKQAQSNRTTVGEIRKELEASGDVSIIDTRIDSQGREQPAHKPSKDEVDPARAIKAPADTALEVADIAGADAAETLLNDKCEHFLPRFMCRRCVPVPATATADILPIAQADERKEPVEAENAESTDATVAPIFLDPAAVIAWFNLRASRKERLEILGGIEIDAAEFLEAIPSKLRRELSERLPKPETTTAMKKRRAAEKADKELERRAQMREPTTAIPRC